MRYADMEYLDVNGEYTEGAIIPLEHRFVVDKLRQELADRKFIEEQTKEVWDE